SLEQDGATHAFCLHARPSSQGLISFTPFAVQSCSVMQQNASLGALQPRPHAIAPISTNHQALVIATHDANDRDQQERKTSGTATKTCVM
ncbi:MAG TPA: hypothetical protein VIU61_16540, partial [Kofleriaceae bacterium]